MDWLRDFHFLRPALLLLLAFPILYLWRSLKKDGGTSAWEKVCDKKLLRFLLINDKNSTQSLKSRLISLALAVAILSVAGPSWRQNENAGIYHENAVFVLLDLSSDMRKTGDAKPDNLTRAKIEITDFLNALPMAQTGLIVYTNEPFVISPLSSDARLIINLLPAVTPEIMPANGNKLDRAIDLAVNRFQTAGYPRGNIVVFSQSAGESFEQSIQAARHANLSGYHVSVLGVSSSAVSQLEQIAKSGGGVYENLSTGVAPLDAFVLNAEESLWREGSKKVSSFADDGYYLLFLPLLCCLYFFRRGALMVLLLMFLSFNAEAGFLFNDNFEAMRLFEKKQYEQAARKFKNEEWKGTSYYKAKNFENAAKAFAESTDIETRYNYANALAKAGNLEEAIKTYEEVLAQNPDHEDAKFNLEYLKQMMQQQQQKENNQPQNDSKQKSQNDNKENNSDSHKEDSFQAEEKEKQDKLKEQDRQTKSLNKPDNQIEEKPNEQAENEGQNRQDKFSETSAEQVKQNPMQAKEGGKNEEYNEEAQAKEQLYRQISEDKGGLLRAFIRKEYLKNRYGE